MNKKEKLYIKEKLKETLSKEKEVFRIIIFGSFLNSKSPRDLDVSVFQNSKEKYLNLSLKYRKLTRDIAKIIPLDIIPIKENSFGTFLNEINLGEVIYERRN
ncbi:MAG: nucleotidyltransferase domain-containing protein [Mariniphaga sp.]|nr:nucleotidyltransferase domain-containing protein [Mariniphaga sp.]